MLEGDQSAAGYLTTGRIMTGDKQIRDHGHGFGVVQTLPIRLGSAQSSDEIAPWVLGATGRQLVDIGLQLCDRLRRFADLLGRHDEEHRAQRVSPLPEYLDIGVRYAQQAAD